jgi:hypothetical protein
MGTSSSYGGPGGGTPLVPSWVDVDVTFPAGTAPPVGGDADTDAPESAEAGPDGAGPASGAPPTNPSPTAGTPPPPDPSRFTAPRANLTRFARSGGTDRRSLGRAVSGYVSGAAGGAASAARRLGASRRASVALLGFLSDARARGVPAALRALNLEALAGRSVEEIFIGLADFVCPDGGTVDDGIAREAFVETIVQLSEEGVTSIESLSPDQMQTVFEIYATNAIEARLCNDIGAKTVALPASPQAAAYVQAQLRDFVRRGVADALTSARAALEALTSESVIRFVDGVYVSAFEILRTMGEAEERK